VVVALSGGSDSVALAHVVRDLEAAGDLQAAGFVHVNHGLRESAGRDEQFCVRLAESFGWRIVVERVDVGARVRRERRSMEAAARAVRYECFDRARAALAADVVALGHTRDDQAETFLLRVVRGAGPKGLAGIHPRTGPVVRPVLSCRRQELREFLAARGGAFVDDETNADVSIPRNRVRAELLPLLEHRFNPAVVDVLADEAELAREMWMWLEESLESGVWSETPGQGGLDRELQGMAEADLGPRAPEAELSVERLLTAPPVLRRHVVWRAMRHAAGGRPISFAHVQAVLELLESDAPRSIDMPGHRVHRLGPRIVLNGRRVGDQRRTGDAGPNFFDYPLSIPGEVPVPQARCVLAADPYPGGAVDATALRGTPATAIVRRDLHTGQWRVRNRRPGDRFRPIGVGGRKKLQDFFVDRKVPRQRRDTVPLVVDERDRIVWVAGFGIDDAFRVNDPSQAVIMLQLKLLGGSA
jgi:tRNA(Ile)-lysidine synthase